MGPWILKLSSLPHISNTFATILVKLNWHLFTSVWNMFFTFPSLRVLLKLAILRSTGRRSMIRLMTSKKVMITSYSLFTILFCLRSLKSSLLYFVLCLVSSFRFFGTHINPPDLEDNLEGKIQGDFLQHILKARGCFCFTFSCFTSYL